MPTDRQRAGLALGPQARSQRAGVRAAIAAGTLDVLALLEGNRGDVEEIALGMRVDALITATPGVGEDTTARILRAACVEPHKRLGALPIARRCAIATAMREEISTDG